MNRSTAWRFMVAAEDDPVLAAWISVCHEYHFIVASDISPYEAWEAFQDLYHHGIVSPAQYDDSDIKKLFFSGPPSDADVQSALERIKFLCPEHEPTKKENTVSKDSFFQKDTALAPREKATALPVPQRAAPLGEIFSPKQESMVSPQKEPGLGIGAFDKPRSPEPAYGLSCQDPDPKNSSHRLTVGNESYQPTVHCGRCGDLLAMTDSGAEILPEDGDPNTDGTLLIAVFQGKCQQCGLIHHCSVAGDPSPDEFRV